MRSDHDLRSCAWKVSSATVNDTTCVEQMEQVRALTEGSPNATRVHAEMAFARFVGLEHGAARLSASTAIDEGRRSGDMAAVVGGTAVLCLMELLANEFESALRLADDIDRFAAQPHALEAHIYQPWFAAALARLEADRLDDVARTVNHGRLVAERTGAAWAIPGYDAVTAFAALRTGEFDDAHTIARATLDYLDGVDGFGVAVWCHAFVAITALHRGDDDASAAALAAAEGLLGSGRAQFGWEQMASARARLHERAGRPDDALAALRAVWETFGAVGVLSGRQEIGPMLVRLALAAGEAVFATDVVSALSLGAATTGSTAFRVDAERAAAWSAADPDRAVDAVALSRQTPRRPVTACALEDAAALLDAAGRHTEAKECAIEALSLWMSTGAPGEADRVATKFRARHAEAAPAEVRVRRPHDLGATGDRPGGRRSLELRDRPSSSTCRAAPSNRTPPLPIASSACRRGSSSPRRPCEREARYDSSGGSRRRSGGT